MVKFADLPSEILMMFLDLLSPSDADAFCQLSRHVRALSAPFIRKHMDLKWRYTTCRNFTARGVEPNGQPANLLRDILEKPHLALYVNRLHINGWRERWGDSGAQGVPQEAPKTLPSEETRYPESTMELFKNAIRNCAMIPEADKEGWISNVSDGDEDPLIALLLLMLPNLVKLRLTSCDGYRIEEMVGKITQDKRTKYLSKLVAVELAGLHPSNEGVEFNDNAVIIKYFSVLPSIKRISALHFDAQDNEYIAAVQVTGRNQKSRITHMSFARCSLNSSVLLEILASTESLTSFSYCPGEYENGFGNYEPMWIRVALLGR